MGFISYETANLEWGLKDSYLVKKASPGNSSVQDFREAMAIIREEIGHGSLIMADQTAYSPVIGLADGVKISHTTSANWNESGAKNMIRETWHSQYFNNTLWQNNPGEIELTGNAFTEDEKISLALWKAFLGGTVGTSDDFTDWNPGQLEFFRFLEPAKRYQNARFPYWPSFEEIKVAVRQYFSLQSWGVLFFNDKNIPVDRTFPVSDLIEKETAFVFGWKPGPALEFGKMKEINIRLLPHQSRLFWLSEYNKPPLPNLTLGGRLI